MSAEPCVYERLWESIAVLRESGQRYGMSERDIERFITQVLETNEPQEEQPAFPLLRATAKCALALCLLLVLALGLSQPQSASEPLSLGLNWSCPLGAARLLDLPIAHKYNLQGFRGWFGDSPLLQSSVNTSISSEARVVMKGGDVSQLHRSLLELVCLSQDDFCHRNEVLPGPAEVLPRTNFTTEQTTFCDGSAP
ncbi:hypothetical protein NQD34_007804 [Periophthalmus magnuspinnatus]|uniref:bombesin receptor-activated protein C6orf89 homolog isoform X1 n=1 Tax=Periophthalmus magnuspinnatus TaxID=409849 RepID=UPI00145ABCF7|nr:bombesin receptor-activated protein C6orf89 homolog isoform X1 [Periophthalmus magnuspinnatus]XP_033830109.1 bombesin receptor-activated protein C6orf89 homolog isoform X1 [Periophthalmus magnuspinnatus]KAJ0002655.1 hypothetical protein NQD34_007804 [Periophthalmus magnuspinnatus]